MDRSRSDHVDASTAVATPAPTPGPGLIVSIEDAAAWQRHAIRDGGDFSTPARALPLTGSSGLNPLVSGSDSSRRSGIESARSGAAAGMARASFHAHSRSLDDTKLHPPLPVTATAATPSSHRRLSSSDKDDSALHLLNTKEHDGALLPTEQPPQQQQQQHEQHCPLEPTTPGFASGAINSTAATSMLKSLQSRAGSAHQLGAAESIPRPSQPLRFASEPALLQPRPPSQPAQPEQPQQQESQPSPPRADTPRPAPLRDSDCSTASAVVPSASSTATPAVPAVRRGSQFDISQPRAPASYLDESGVQRSKAQHRRKESEDLRAEGPPQLCSPPQQPQKPQQSDAALSKPDSTCTVSAVVVPVPAPAPVPAVAAAPSKNLRIFLHETEVGRNLMLSRLCSGGIFLKLGARGSPHYRLVRVTPDLLNVSWCDLKHTEKVRGSIPVLSISRVDRGHASRIFRERAPKSSVAMHCFSLRSESRTLDLECCSQEEADLWVLAFGFLIEYTQKRRKSMPAEETASQLRSDDEPSVDRTACAGDPLDLSTSSMHASGGHRPRKRSISLVSALDVLCDHSRLLSEPNTPQTNSDPALLTGQENYSSDDLLPALPPEIMFDAQLNPCRAATAATAAAMSSASSSESISSGGSNSAATASASSSGLVPPLLPASGSQLETDPATADVHLLTQCLPLSMARQIDSSLDATLDGALSLEIDGAAAAPPQGPASPTPDSKTVADSKPAAAVDSVLPPPIRVLLPPVAEVDDVTSTAGLVSAAGHATMTTTTATTVPEATETVERLTTAPSSFPDQAKETTTSTEPAARSPHQLLQHSVSSPDQAAAQLQREFHKLSELNQQANRIYTPIVADGTVSAAHQQQQPQLPNFPLCFPGGRLSTGSVACAPSGCAGGPDGGGVCQTPFLLDPAQFAQQDIFDLSTFAHLAAETAAEYGRALPKEQFEEMHAAATAAQLAQGSSNAVAPSITAPGGAPHAGPMALSQSQLRALHDREVSAYIASDARLSRIHRNLCKYRAEYGQLEEAFAVKLARLQMELSELQSRNEKLKKLHEKMQVTTREKREFATQAQALRASLAPLPPPISASASPHLTHNHNHTPGSGAGWTQPMQH